ncbi:hypothetical protein NJH49_02345 [Stenotrophomonas maltophilia]|jgi:hypothetical protein|uniref:hypothetical protein n=1 Tax=Pseudomonadota TaxID=1224 RepID=UPI0011B35EAB|nr:MULTISPECIES: hypothetical protein [Stenotrophomonas]MBN4936596.1 hypothetical protein [Stenotrophomonas maltophilia]MCO7400003.1 hypothetical protein [Stenotrophomonas maltophilia]MCO7410231.1 hypothetical protein [Stenotrophomonas maltophilia]MCU1092802.1 hypothetical protein [Stenotrophomonas maltophilia]MDH0170541.1 hypothetical protein [Stenotrophomonas sp. GD04145]
MRQGETAESEDSKNAVSEAYYVFRVKKRDVHGVSLVAAIWFIWSQGGEVVNLFKNLFEALA